MKKWDEVADDMEHSSSCIKGFAGEYRWLSNFYDESAIRYNGIMYFSSEAAYQAAKSNDPKIWEKFAGYSASIAKKEGQLIEKRKDWDEVKQEIMYEILCDKFTRNIALQQMLLNTGYRYLEETNWWNDQYWGVYKGEGQNHLGKILMQIRGELKFHPSAITSRMKP